MSGLSILLLSLPEKVDLHHWSDWGDERFFFFFFFFFFFCARYFFFVFLLDCLRAFVTDAADQRDDEYSYTVLSFREHFNRCTLCGQHHSIDVF